MRQIRTVKASLFRDFKIYRYSRDTSQSSLWFMRVPFSPWASCQILKIDDCAWVSGPDMHLGTWVMHVPWCMPGSLTSGFLWSRWRGKRFRNSQRMRNPQFYVSSKRPMWLIEWDMPSKDFVALFGHSSQISFWVSKFISWSPSWPSVTHYIALKYLVHEHIR